MAVLNELEPKKVFQYFEEICNIPHPSYHEEKISNYLVEYAKAHNLEYYQDEVFNVIMIKEASEGYEDVEPIIIQGHMDMVAEKLSSCNMDMEKEGLDLAIDGDYVYAKDTTLGGDDGIAVAMALAILEDETLKHPRIEFICTVCEEVGMEGATALDVSKIKGKRLLNIDSEDEGYFTVGCAGGCRINIDLKVKREKFAGKAIEIEVAECAGGHSGVEIIKGRANASHIANRLLSVACDIAEIRMISFEGGTKDNAIPRDTKAEIIVAAEDCQVIADALLEEATAISNEYAITDPNMEITITDGEPCEAKAVVPEDTEKIVYLLNSMPDGIQTMSHDIEGLPETSLNLGILSLSEETFHTAYALRSALETAKSALIRKVELVAKSYDAETSRTGIYPAWEYVRDSKFRDSAIAIFEEMYGKKPVIDIIHAGLECGILATKIPGLDAISIGPDLLDIHTPQEKLSISSTQRVYDFVRKVIEMK